MPREPQDSGVALFVSSKVGIRLWLVCIKAKYVLVIILKNDSGEKKHWTNTTLVRLDVFIAYKNNKGLCSPNKHLTQREITICIHISLELLWRADFYANTGRPQHQNGSMPTSELTIEWNICQQDTTCSWVSSVMWQWVQLVTEIFTSF